MKTSEWKTVSEKLWTKEKPSLTDNYDTDSLSREVSIEQSRKKTVKTDALVNFYHRLLIWRKSKEWRELIMRNKDKGVLTKTRNARKIETFIKYESEKLENKTTWRI
jgi:hypothetical protein